MRRVERRRCADDTGASLILAIAFMTFLGLVVSSVLTYTGTSLRSAKSTEIKAQSTYDIDGALQAAVNKVRIDEPPGFFTNTAGQTCPALSSPDSKFAGQNMGAEIAVTCTAGVGTGGAGGTVEINPNNRPANALLTLGAGSEIGIDKGSNNALLVNGGVYVNSRPTSIRQSGSACAITPLPPSPPVSCSGMWVQNGNLTARGACNGTIVVAPPSTKSCSAANPIAPDPAYSQPAGPLTYKAVPTCGAGPTVTFEQGYYDDAVALTNLTNGITCPGKTLWFQPGVYYFDFHNGEGPLPAAPHVWTIDDPTADVVGGTPQGWLPALGNPIVPGSCVSPLASAANDGVEFVFGGDSRLDVRAGNIELCGRYSATRPPIALYGARTGADPAATGPITAKLVGTPTTVGPAFASPENIAEADSVPATAVINGGPGDVTSEVTINGFVPPTLPAGSILTNAELVVRHRDNNAAGSALKSLQVEFSSTRVGAASNAFALTDGKHGPSGLAYLQENINVTTALAGEVHRYGLAGLQVRYAATVAPGNTVTENLDSVQFKLTWKPPAVRGQTTPVNGVANCIAIVGAGGCPMIKTVSPNTRLYIHGTVYAPLAKLDLKMTNVSIQVVSVGVLVRALAVQVTASAALGSLSMINVPPLASGGPVTPLEVYFRAYTCPSGGCGAAVPGPGWKLSGTARAKYENLAAQGYDKVTVLSWTVRGTA